MLHSSWKYVFQDLDLESENTQNEIAVHCPFHTDNIRSAHLNTEKNVLHCKTCGKGWNIYQIIGKDKMNILRKIKNKGGGLNDWNSFHSPINGTEDIAETWNFNPKTIKELDIKRIGEEDFTVPFLTRIGNIKILLGYSSYQSSRQPKWLQSKGSLAGLIFPHIEWIKNKDTTIICAGPKDTLITRSFGFNAITFSGGEKALPIEKSLFKGRDIVIAYDNDETGIAGAKKLANYLGDVVKSIKILKNIYQVTKEKGEDLYDYFTKYKKVGVDFSTLVAQEEFFKYVKVDKYEKLKTIRTKTEALAKHNRRVWLKANIKIISQLDNPMEVPASCTATVTRKGNIDPIQHEWVLEGNNYEQIFNFMTFKKTWNKELTNVILNKLQISVKDRKTADVDIKITGYATVQSFSFAFLSLSNEEDSKEGNPNELMVGYICDEYHENPNFSANDELEIIYQALSDEKTNVVLAIKDYRNSSHFLDSFEITDEVIESLKLFQPSTSITMNGTIIKETKQTVDDKLKELWNKSRDNKFTRNFIRFNLFLANELVFCSPWKFNLCDVSIPAVLDILIVGDTETGKSTTANGMINWYNQGKSINLSSATKIALLGGTKEIGGKKFTFVGVIPASHKRLIVMEEYETVLSKNSSGDMDKFMLSYRDVRSKGELSIERAQGSIRVACKIRSIMISNAPKGQQISSFEDGGYSVIKGLKLENPDISRFTFAMLVAQSDFMHKDNKVGMLTPFAKQDYRNRLQWIWTRKEEDIIIGKDVVELINKEADVLKNKYYVADFPLVGQKVDEKLAMVSVAIATTLCSTSDFVTVDVLKEHVVEAIKFFNSIYGEKPFRLSEYVEKQKEFSSEAVTEETIEIIARRYDDNKDAATMDIISNRSTIKLTEFKHYFDGNLATYNQFITWLNLNKFTKMYEKELLITGKFKEGMRRYKASDRIRRPQRL